MRGLGFEHIIGACLLLPIFSVHRALAEEVPTDKAELTRVDGIVTTLKVTLLEIWAKFNRTV